ncbi:hypothetical protein Vadar_015969 [Vaccinium darrowii]|uniref:Uncharacterized protein n=1 Tax=Vaccinium darrowii TaxID=229202 RepID=A0ACB7XRC6_9ERIC|nr:hypothetical protein Vadar_015969 [Vaccinium darrowii]
MIKQGVTDVEVDDESLTREEVEEQEDVEDAPDTQPPGGPEDRSLLDEGKDSKFRIAPIALITHYVCNSHRISAFVERWHPETNSFHFDFGEMGPKLDDVEKLLGIPTYGLAVQQKDARDAKTLVRYLLGVLENEAKNALAEAKGGQAVTFGWLRLYFSDLRDNDTDERVTYCSRAYLLYMLGCTLLCDKTGSKVNVSPLALLEDLDRVSHYGWGASALAFLYRQLGQASRRDTKQLSCFLTLLEAWIDEHFPVFNPVTNPDYTEDLPRALRWVSRRESGTSQSYYRQLLHDLGADQVIFNLYKNHRQVVPSNAFYTGPIRAMHIVEPHLPDRVLGQFGLVQQIPADPMAPTYVLRGVKKYVVDYQWTGSDYLGWLRKVSHSRVGCGEGIVGGSIAERVDAVLAVVDNALGNETLQPLELRVALKEVQDILRPTRTLTTYFMRRGQGRGQG